MPDNMYTTLQKKASNALVITLTSVSDINGSDLFIENIPDNVMSSSEPVLSKISIRSNASNSITVNTGSDTIFVNIPTSAGKTPLEKVTKAAELLSAASVNGLSVACVVTGTDDAASLHIRPRNNTLSFSGATVGASSEWTGTVYLDTAPTLIEIYKNRAVVSTYDPFSGVIVLKDSSGSDIAQATGDTIAIRGVRIDTGDGSGILKSIPAYTK